MNNEAGKYIAYTNGFINRTGVICDSFGQNIPKMPTLTLHMAMQELLGGFSGIRMIYYENEI